MRAVVHDLYGPPDVLRVGDVELPVPDDDEVLVRVHASTVTRGYAMGVRSVHYRLTHLFTRSPPPPSLPRRSPVATRWACAASITGSPVSSPAFAVLGERTSAASSRASSRRPEQT